jgi:antirestriction protein ArdC
MINYLTRKPYTGQNAAILSEFDSEGFLTYLQAKSIGRRAVKGTGIELIRVVVKKVKDKKTGEVKMKKLPKRFWVFPIEETQEMEAA